MEYSNSLARFSQPAKTTAVNPNYTVGSNEAGLFNTKPDGVYNSKQAQAQANEANALANPHTSLALNPKYSKFTSDIKDQWGSFGSPDGGLGSYGTYEYGPSTNSQTGQVIPGGSVGVNADAYGAINNPDVTPSAGGAGMTMSDVGGYAGLANAGINAFNAFNSNSLGKKNLSLAQEKFGFEKATANANYMNQAKLTNNAIQNSGEVGMSLAGNTMNDADRLARQTQMTGMKVNAGPIG